MSGKINYLELIKILSENSDISADVIKAILELLTNVLQQESLINGKTIHIKGLGSFSLKHSPPHKTKAFGRECVTKDKKRLVFKAGSRMKIEV